MHQDYATITAAIPLLAHPTPQQVLGARLTVACHARTPDDCRLLLDVLGLDTTTAGPWQRPQRPLTPAQRRARRAAQRARRVAAERELRARGWTTTQIRAALNNL